MVNLQDLRIGNIIMESGEPLIVSWENLGYIHDRPQDYDPIPISAEWLVGIGFSKITIRGRWIDTSPVETYDYVYITDLCDIKIRFIEGYTYVWFKFNLEPGEYYEVAELRNYDSKIIIKQSVYHLHQLQNLYHALTGNELKIAL